jgi:hypothetical protein
VTLPSFESIDIYGPPLRPDDVDAAIASIWRASASWVERVAVDRDTGGESVEAFLRAVQKIRAAEADGIACTFSGKGHEFRLSTARRRLKRPLRGGTDSFQQTHVAITGARSAEFGLQTLHDVAESVSAWFGDYTPQPDALLLHLKLGGLTQAPAWREAGRAYNVLRDTTELPAVPIVNIEKWTRALVPFRLGWANYWSDETCRTLGFPDATRDAQLLAHSSRLAGGWLVRLSASPLQLSHPEDLQLLAQTYRRFPEIGTLWCR